MILDLKKLIEESKELREKGVQKVLEEELETKKCIFKTCNCTMSKEDEGWEEVHRNMYDKP